MSNKKLSFLPEEKEILGKIEADNIDKGEEKAAAYPERNHSEFNEFENYHFENSTRIEISPYFSKILTEILLNKSKKNIKQVPLSQYINNIIYLYIENNKLEFSDLLNRDLNEELKKLFGQD